VKNALKVPTNIKSDIALADIICAIWRIFENFSIRNARIGL